jgi:Ca2+-binding RTX toxin-like protein
VFVFAKGFGIDLLDDFVAGQDKLDFSAFGIMSMSQLASNASLVALSANTMSVDFGGGDKLTIYGVDKLTADNVIFAGTGGSGGGTSTITGTAGEDRLSGKDNVNDVIDGRDGHDTLRGMGGNDTLRGGTGNDQLYGGTGDDRLEGGVGSDYLFGDGGNDRLEGGVGNDLLHGGAGSDVFVFAKGFGIDLLDDFVAGQDKLDLSAFGLGGMSGLAAKANVVALSANTMSVDFGGGDKLTIYGVSKLTADNVIF